MSAARELVGYLKERQALGQTHVYLDEEAKDVLRDLYLEARQLRSGGGRGNTTRTGQANGRHSAVNETANEQEPAADSAEMAAHFAEMRKNLSQPEGSGEGAVAKGGPNQGEVAGRLTLIEGSKREQLRDIAKKVKRSQALRGLDTLRDKMVFAIGNPDAEVMFVGEAPGFNEELKGEPFVGAAGEKFNQILKAMGLEREAIYLSNVVKFRPALPGQSTNNRAPSEGEIAASLPFILAEIEVVKPKLVVALGGTAAQALLGVKAPVAELRGSFHQLDGGVPMRVTYHPSYLLHNNSSMGERRKVWEDMLAVMEKLGMPISSKQRGYFQ